MRVDLSVPSQLSWALLPDLVLAGGAMLLLVYAAWRPASAAHQRRVGVASIALMLVTAAVVVYMAMSGVSSGPGPIAVDNFRWAADLIFLGGAILTVMLAMDYNERELITAPESHVLVLLATSGMFLLSAARDLTLVFLGIELMSVATYVLVGINRRSARSAEGALKYFLLGAFSTAFLLYGMALVYGATGATNFGVIAERLAADPARGGALLKVGTALLVVGLGFKVAAAPFHMWAPDAYEGAPTPHSAFMAASIKAAAFAVFLRLFIEAFPSTYAQSWHEPIWWLAAVTMVVGNIAALSQKNIKRMLAYSSIAHAGYVLVAVVVGAGQVSQTGVSGSSAFLFYLVSYTLATMGAFAIVAALGSAGEPHLNIDDYSGLWTVRPGLTLAMSVFMLALLGFPVFGGMGFFAKWYMLQAALRGGAAPQTQLAVWLVFTSVLSAGYYLYVVTVMFVRPRAVDAPPLARVGGLTNAVIGLCVATILFFGFMPTHMLRGVSRSALRGTPVPAAVPAPATPFGAPVPVAPPPAGIATAAP
ncbi:MAG TPA: NADH-quinone oxidoreductase subunit N [Gemmatimonadaceae bacterium]|nr:NADH-quinone oxidoreductase subunit N [Gemmatimonadaceae bacterium]